MERKHEFFAHAVQANLTGEQCRVLMRLLSCAINGEIAIKQNVIAADLGITESNVSRSIKALIDADLISKCAVKGRDHMPVFRVKKVNKSNQTQVISDDPQAAWNALYDAHVRFIKELYIVDCSLDILRVVGLNSPKLKGPGADFVRFSSLLSQRAIVTGIESLFDRKEDGAGLCSIRGILSLAQNVDLKNPEAAKRFASKYGVDSTNDWQADTEKILKKQRPLVTACMSLTSKIRNERVAHLAQSNGNEEPYVLPSFDVFSRLIEYADDFYIFIATGFLNNAGAKLSGRIGQSLHGLLKKRFEIEDALYDFPEMALQR